jgi:undecaprenyl-diphosphatase
MSDIIKAIILGIIEGLTEFLPISSTGHLIIVEDFLQLSIDHPETFSIAIQLGAILAVVFYHKEYFISLLFKERWFSQKMNAILLAIIPVMILGFFSYSFIKSTLFNPKTVIAALFIGAIIMAIVEFLAKKKPPQTVTLETISYKQALTVGLFQCLSLWPGFSRSGATIIGGIYSGLPHSIAAEFSFIISVPVMIIAVMYDLIKTASVLSSNDLQIIGIGFIVSFIVGYSSILWLLKVLKRASLTPFIVYRILLSGVLALWFF